MLEQFMEDPITISEKIEDGKELTRRIISAGKREILFEDFKGKRLASNLWADREKLCRIYGEDHLGLLKLLLKCSEKRSEIVEGERIWDRKISLREIPVPKFFPRDGGPYLTASIVIAKYDGVVNASYHRLMKISDEEYAIRLVPRHLYSMWRKAMEEGKELEIAVAIGVEPDVAIAAAMSPEYGVNELEIASSLHKVRTGKPLEVSYLHGIPVPAKAEYVLYGKITRDLVKEGPFVDVTRTRDRVREQPKVVFEEAYSSEDPILHAILPGGYEHMNLMGMPREASIYDSVSKVVPEVFGVRLTEGGGGWLHAVISIRKQHEGDGKNAILAAFAGHPSLKRVIVVDQDVDIFNDEEVEWAISTRVRPDLDVVIIPGARASTLDPSSQDGLIAKWGIDATIPLGEEEKFENVFKAI